MNPLLELLGGVGYALDTPGAYTRGLLAGRPGERVAGRDMLEAWGLLDPNQEGLDWGDVAGFGADVAVDPLNLLSGAAAVKYGGKAASSLGRLLGLFTEHGGEAAKVAASVIPEVAGEATGELAAKAPSFMERIAANPNYGLSGVDMDRAAQVAEMGTTYADPFYSRTLEALQHPKFPESVGSWEQARKSLERYGASPAELDAVDPHMREFFNPETSFGGPRKGKWSLEIMLDTYLPKLETQVRDVKSKVGAMSDPKAIFEEYSTPGGLEGSYGERVLHTAPPPEALVAFDEYNTVSDEAAKAWQEVEKLSKKATTIVDPKTGYSRFVPITQHNSAAYQAATDKWKALDQRRQALSEIVNHYSGMAEQSHFNAPHDLGATQAWYRKKDYLGPEGEKILHVLESQSDLYQGGGKGLLKKSWPEATLKRAIREAAEGGYSRLSLGTGDEAFINSADGSLKQIKQLEEAVTKLGLDPTATAEQVTAVLRNRQMEDEAIRSAGGLTPPGWGAAHRELVQIEQALGPRASNWRRLKGLRDFYDVRLPKTLEKIGKPHGAMVEPAAVSGAEYGGVRAGDLTEPEIIDFLEKADFERADLEGIDWDKMDAQQFQHLMPKGVNPPRASIRITPELARQALYKGFPLASIAGLMGAYGYSQQGQ